MKQIKTLTALLLIAFTVLTSCSKEDLTTADDNAIAKYQQVLESLGTFEEVEALPQGKLNLACRFADAYGYTYEVNTNIFGSGTYSVTSPNGSIVYSTNVGGSSGGNICEVMDNDPDLSGSIYTGQW